MSTYQRSDIPLYLWPIIGGLFFAIIALFPSKYLEYQLDKKRLETFAQEKSPNCLQIIALGSSRTQCGVFFDQKMESLYASLYPSQIHFLRFTKSGAIFSAFESIFAEILAVRPDLILLEPEMLFYKKKDSHFSLLNYLNTKQRAFYLITSSGKKKYQEEQEKELNKGFLGVRQTKEVLEHVQFLKSFLLSESIAPSVDQFLKKAKEQGVRLILLDFPRSKIIEDELEEKRRLEKLAIAHCQNTYGMEVWTFNLPESNDSWYLDFGHFNERGQEQFSAWLIEAIASVEQVHDLL